VLSQNHFHGCSPETGHGRTTIATFTTITTHRYVVVVVVVVVVVIVVSS